GKGEKVKMLLNVAQSTHKPVQHVAFQPRADDSWRRRAACAEVALQHAEVSGVYRAIAREVRTPLVSRVSAHSVVGGALDDEVRLLGPAVPGRVPQYDGRGAWRGGSDRRGRSRGGGGRSKARSNIRRKA